VLDGDRPLSIPLRRGTGTGASAGPGVAVRVRGQSEQLGKGRECGGVTRPNVDQPDLPVAVFAGHGPAQAMQRGLVGIDGLALVYGPGTRSDHRPAQVSRAVAELEQALDGAETWQYSLV